MESAGQEFLERILLEQEIWNMKTPGQETLEKENPCINQAMEPESLDQNTTEQETFGQKTLEQETLEQKKPKSKKFKKF